MPNAYIHFQYIYYFFKVVIAFYILYILFLTIAFLNIAYLHVICLHILGVTAPFWTVTVDMALDALWTHIGTQT
jgi:hypothetical protein